MREIIFRGMDDESKEWKYGSFISSWKTPDNRKIGESILTENQCFTVIPETVGQFTGLKDKNETDIYEGDIVKFTYCPELLKNEHIGIVAVNKYNQWCIKIDEKEYIKSDYTGINEFHIENAMKGEAIGNIHENKDLLKNVIK